MHQNKLIVLIAVMLVAGCVYNGDTSSSTTHLGNVTEQTQSLPDPLKNVRLFYQSDVLFLDKDGNPLIRVDPYHVRDKNRAKYVLITHGHFDHCSPDDVKKVMRIDGKIITTQDCAEKLREYQERIKVIKPGDHLEFPEFTLDAIPAYNVKKDRQKYHPKENNWVGFIIHLNGYSYYIAGDTDIIDEMKQLKDITVAFLPIGGKFTMDADEAAEAVSIIKPKYAVPCHYYYVLKTEDKMKKAIERFKNMAGVDVYPIGIVEDYSEA